MASGFGETRRMLPGRSTKPRKQGKGTQNITTTSGSNQQPLSPYNICTEHGGISEDLFCVNHNSMICAVCRRTYHGKCKNVTAILDASIDYSKRKTTDFCKSQTRHLIKQCKAVARERDRDIKEIDAKRNEIIKSVKAIKYKIIDKVEKMTEKVIDDLQKIHDIETGEMEEHLTFLNEMIYGLEASDAYIGEAKKESRDLSLFISVQNLMKKQVEMTSVLEQIHDDAHKVILKFEVDKTAEAVLEKFRSIGDIKLQTNEYNVIPRPQRMINLNTDSASYMAPEEHTIRKPVSERRAFHVEDMNIRDADDTETCWITGMTVLKDSTLLLADNNNKRIKLLGSNHVTLGSLQTQTPPFDIDLLDQENAVFTLPESKQIQFIKIEGKSDMKSEREISVDFDCNAISVFKDNLIVTSIAEKSVISLTLKGDVLWRTGMDSKGVRLFDWPWYVVSNTTAGEIYISDRQKNTISTLDGGGKVARVRDVRGKGPRGMVMDDVGNMYVCYYMTDQVEITCTYHARDRRNLLSKADGIKHPQSVTFDTQNGRLFVSANSSDFVSVYQIN